jgi:hypothetical protein
MHHAWRLLDKRIGQAQLSQSANASGAMLTDGRSRSGPVGWRAPRFDSNSCWSQANWSGEVAGAPSGLNMHHFNGHYVTHYRE